MEQQNHFLNIREQTLQLWEEGTKRLCILPNDNYQEGYECKWQNEAEKLGYWHISVFCSLGEWASNISDLLLEGRYDFYDFLQESERQALFRHYTRFMLVLSEILTDFQDIVIEAEALAGDRRDKEDFARKFLSASGKPNEIQTLFDFINSVCKHKVRNLHRCNHHLPVWFEDCKELHPFLDPARLENFARIRLSQPPHYDSIVMPKLSYLVQVVLNCYGSLDKLFISDESKFRKVCDNYNDAENRTAYMLGD